jgi:hypothetical protein
MRVQGEDWKDPYIDTSSNPVEFKSDSNDLIYIGGNFEMIINSFEIMTGNVPDSIDQDLAIRILMSILKNYRV